MRKMEWGAFRDAHYRPSQVVLFLPIGMKAEDGEGACEVLAGRLRPAGDHAMKREGGRVRVAFELERDARRFARAAGARQTLPEPEWELTLVGRLDRPAGRPKPGSPPGSSSSDRAHRVYP